jgi:uncharacterized UBP type Zn finger protein
MGKLNELLLKLRFRRRQPQETCHHLEVACSQPALEPNTIGCEECLQSGDRWVHLRLCLACGHVGCCDNSRNKHATAHFHATGHPVIRSFEPGESWVWCYEHEVIG